jgi:APA family basic amino acid/polyamine antiporter
MTSKNNLVRSLGLRYVVAIVIASVVGSGVYKKVAPMADGLHSSGWVLIAWVLAGLITLFGALSYAEITGLLAETGGEYAYFKKIYNRFFSFIYGWSLFTVANTAAISSIAYVCSESLNNILNLPPLFSSLATFTIGGVFYPFDNFTVKLIAIFIIIGLTMINTRTVKTGAGLGNALVLLVLFGIIIIIGFGLNSDGASITRSLSLHTTNGYSVTTSAIFTAMLAAFWAYQGWNNIGYIGGEVKNPHKVIPIGIAIGLGIIITIYLLINATYLSVLPIESFETLHTDGGKIAAVEVVRSFWGYNGAMFISFLIFITTLGCTHAQILTCARPYYAMAREGLFFAKIGELNKSKVPQNALLIQGIWAAVLVLSGSFDQLTDMSIFAIFIFYGANGLGVFILRRTMPDAKRPYKAWGYPIIPAIYVIFCALFLVNTLYTRPREAVIGMVLMLSGIPVYFWLQKKYVQTDEQNQGFGKPEKKLK